MAVSPALDKNGSPRETCSVNKNTLVLNVFLVVVAGIPPVPEKV